MALGQLTFGALVWARPHGLWLLLLPLALWILSRVRPRPRDVLVGTVDFWSKLGTHSDARTLRAYRAAPPPWMWCILGSLTLGALAISGPRARESPSGRVWTVVVDGSPSMFLAMQPPPATGEAEGSETRLEVALERARKFLEGNAGPADRVRWKRPGHATLDLARDEWPAPDWLAPSRHFEEEPRWSFHDRPGHLWLTDHAEPLRALRVERAGWLAVGGPAVPGLVAGGGVQGDGLLWTGQAGAPLVRRPGASSTQRRAVSARFEDPAQEQSLGPLLEFLRLWAHERGLRFEPHANATEDAALVVAFARPLASDAPVRAGRDRWHLSGSGTRIAPTSSAAHGDAWLLAHPPGEEPWPLVVSRPGHISIGWSSTGEPAGDPTAFALGWSRLFESALLPQPGVVPLAERIAAGDAAAHVPEDPTRETSALAASHGLLGTGLSPEAGLAAAAWLAGLIGVLLSTRR